MRVSAEITHIDYKTTVNKLLPAIKSKASADGDHAERQSDRKPVRYWIYY